MADNNGKFFKETPVGNLYGGYMQNYPRKGGGDDTSAWLGLNDYLARLSMVNSNNGNTSFHASVDMPKQVLPDYFNEINTPVGKVGLATNFPHEPGAEINFLPNEQTQAYINVLKSLLNR
jgi:hypothetical protein